MSHLVNYGTFKIKDIYSKSIKFYDDTSNSILLHADQDSTNYSIRLPENAPTTQNTGLQIQTNTIDTDWKPMVLNETGADVASATDTSNNRIFSETPSNNTLYRIDNSWMDINNWNEHIQMPIYNSTVNLTQVHHDTDTDKFYIASLNETTFHRCTTSSYKTPVFVDLDSASVPGHTPKFDTNNLQIIHDGFNSTDNGYNNGVMVLKNWVTANPAYIEWELVTTPTGTLGSMDLYVGFINKLATDNPLIPSNQTDWASIDHITIDHGINVTLVLGQSLWFVNQTGPTIPITGEQQVPTDYVVEVGDKIQFFYDNLNNSAEITYLKHNHIIYTVQKTGLTNSNLSDKCYYASSGLSSRRWRVSTNPLPYMGALIPYTYILNYE